MKGIIAGVIAGFAGAVVWALIAVFANIEIGWLAWGIGAAVGAAVAWGSEGTPAMGVAAVIISVLAIVGGKYISVEMALAKEMGNADEYINTMTEDEENLIFWMADLVVAQIEEAGGTVAWPKGARPDGLGTKDEYPREIWTQAQQALATMTPENKDEFKELVRQQMDENIAMNTADLKKEGFLASFSLFDVLFFFLAIGTAYKIGSKAD